MEAEFTDRMLRSEFLTRLQVLDSISKPLKIYCYLLIKYYKGWSGIKHTDREFKNDK